jgi:4-hydroxy-3-methylbut-2-enyl diphosphate reductase IspH
VSSRVTSIAKARIAPTVFVRPADALRAKATTANPVTITKGFSIPDTIQPAVVQVDSVAIATNPARITASHVERLRPLRKEREAK